MMRRLLSSNGGFTYIAALAMVIITGIMAARVAQDWKTAMQREKEAELIFRGSQIRDAMRRWYKGRVVEGKWVEPYPPQTPRPPNLPELKALLLDPNSLTKQRYLRPSSLIDPMTGKEWDLVRDATQKIVGVKSGSEKVPIKQANFPYDLNPADFEGKQKYSEWQFVYNVVPPPAAGGTITGAGGRPSPGTPPPAPAP